MFSITLPILLIISHRCGDSAALSGNNNIIPCNNVMSHSWMEAENNVWDNLYNRDDKIITHGELGFVLQQSFLLEMVK